MIINNKVLIEESGIGACTTEESMLSTLTEENANRIFEYAGSTTSLYTQNHFYKVTPDVKPLGGTIFYISPRDNHADYQFFDEDYYEIKDWTIDNLSKAKYYYTNSLAQINGAFKFYIIDETSIPDDDTRIWGGGQAMRIINNYMGAGWFNTNQIIKERPEMGGAFSYIQDLRNDNYKGCNDWYVPCRSELNALLGTSIGQEWKIRYNLWTSEAFKENYRFYAYLWSVHYKKIDSYGVGSKAHVPLMRAI